MKKSSTIVLIAGVFLFNTFSAVSQPSLTGASCVLTGTEYQYNIQGNIPQGAQLCVTGGKITGSSTNCVTNLSSGYVRIVWTGTKGSVSLSSSEGNNSMDITMTSLLDGGVITTSKQQYINYNNSSSSISCSKPSGGGCETSYSYQWQQSFDNLKWQNIDGAITQNLVSIPSLTQTSFFRRRTTDNASGTIAYSDAAVVFVGPDTAGH